MKSSVINRSARARPWTAVCLSALALLFAVRATGHAQQHQQRQEEAAQTPPAKAAPRVVEAEQRPEAKGVPAQGPAPVVVPGAPVRMPGAVLPAAPAPPAAQTPRAAAPPQAAPRNVVTVVHRLNGWQMLSLMAAKGGERWVIDELPPAAEFHTNIVAGFVSEDGRTVMTRLPTAEAELFASAAAMFPALPGDFAPPPARLEGSPGFTVIRGDGKRVGASFVGLDASTGLSLLEAAEPLFVSTPQAPVVAPAVGQRVRLFAPAPALAPVAPAPPAFAAPPNPAGDSGHTETIYLNIGETKGQLTEVRRASTGKPVQATVRSKLLTPEWAGAIAMNEQGDFVGIVGDSGHTESAIVPAEAIRLARERVLARRASVPRPWLGVRGDAVSRFSLEQMLARGWPRDFALPLFNRPLGVLLTQITPGAPAARAGLRPGDIISRVGEREVSGVEDFSMLLREAGAGARLDLTVLRALERAPLNLTVELSGTLLAGVRPDDVQNPLVGHGADALELSPHGAAPLRARGGLLIVSVHAGTNAARAGLLPGDIVETINGLPVTRASVRRLPGAAPSDMTLGVVRDGRRLDLRLTHAEPPPPEKR